MVKFCRECGSPLTEGARFCRGCGASVLAGTPPATPAAPKAAGVATVPKPAVAATTPGVRKSYLDPPTAAEATAAATTATVAPTAAPGALWDLQNKLQPTMAKVVASVSKWAPPESNIGRPIHRMVKAVFLDAATFQETAADAKLNVEAGICLILSLLAVTVGPAITGIMFGRLELSWLIALLAVQLLASAAFVAGVAYCAPYIIGRALEPLAVMRPVAYAQSPGLFGFIPVVGSLLSLWRIPTTVVAIKDSVQCDTAKAITLLIVGVVCGSITSALLGPPLLRYLAGF